MDAIGLERGAVVENLRAAGMGPELAERFVRCWEKGERDEELAILEGHRRELLERVHAGQRQIDCLDYLAYRLRNGPADGQ